VHVAEHLTDLLVRVLTNTNCQICIGRSLFLYDERQLFQEGIRAPKSGKEECFKVNMYGIDNESAPELLGIKDGGNLLIANRLILDLLDGPEHLLHILLVKASSAEVRIAIGVFGATDSFTVFHFLGCLGCLLIGGLNAVQALKFLQFYLETKMKSRL